MGTLDKDFHFHFPVRSPSGLAEAMKVRARNYLEAREIAMASDVFADPLDSYSPDQTEVRVFDTDGNELDHEPMFDTDYLVYAIPMLP